MTKPSTDSKILEHPSKRTYEFYMALFAREDGVRSWCDEIRMLMFDEDDIKKAREKHAKQLVRQSSRAKRKNKK